MFVVISYDVTDTKRRNKIAKTLLDYGAARVQYSVFEIHVTASNFKRLQARLGRLFNEAEDSLRFYTLCADCQVKIEVKGQGRVLDEPGLRII